MLALDLAPLVAPWRKTLTARVGRCGEEEENGTRQPYIEHKA